MKTPLVIDNGSSLFKIGFAGDPAPRHVFPNLISRPQQNGERSALLIGESCIKSEVQTFIMDHPVQRGQIHNFEDFDLILEYAFKTRVHAIPSEQPLVITASPSMPISDRQHLAQILYEQYSVPSLLMAPPAFFDLYAAGTNTGIAVDIGAGYTHTCAIVHGLIVPDTAQTAPLGGDDIDENLINILRSSDMQNGVSLDLVHQIKEKFASFLPSSDPLSFLANDGREVHVPSAALNCGEVLFSPQNFGKTCSGIQKCVVDTLNGCNEVIRGSMAKSIVIGGGSGKIIEIQKRLEAATKEMGMEIVVDVTLAGPHSAWWGASRYACIPGFGKVAVTAAEYKERGISSLLEKFP